VWVTLTEEQSVEENIIVPKRERDRKLVFRRLGRRWQDNIKIDLTKIV
jgi:hypothetical protein